MSTNAKELAALANDAYVDRANSLSERVPVGGIAYRILDVSNRPSGYQGTAYQRIDTGAVVIAHRGTEPTAPSDVLTDAGMALYRHNDQIKDAIAFTRHAIDAAKASASSRGHALQISITGHSLGGTLAQVTAARFGLPAQTFNAYGAASLHLWHDGVDASKPYPDIVNHARATDVVSAGSPHLGQLRLYADAQDIDTLARAGYHDDGNVLRPRNPVQATDMGAHSIRNFTAGAAAGSASLMAPENAERYRTHAGMIDRYRADVRASQAALSLPFATHVAARDTAAALGQHVGRAALQGADALSRAGVTPATVPLPVLAATGAARAAMHAGTTAGQEIRSAGQAAIDRFGAVFERSPSTSAQAAPFLLTDPAHRDHALFKQAQAGVHALDARHGQASGPRSDQLAGALVVAARQEGITHIDHVVLSRDAARVSAVQDAGKPLVKYASVSTVQALDTPLATSTAQSDRLALQQQLAQAAQEHTQQLHPSQLAHPGPTMSQ